MIKNEDSTFIFHFPFNMNKAEIEFRFSKSIESYDENAFAQKLIIEHLMALLKKYAPLSVSRILEVGCGTGLLTEQLSLQWKDAKLIINDLVNGMCCKAATRCLLPLDNCIAGDIESVTLDDKFDLIVSASTFQWLAHPAETFDRLSRHLNTNGLLVFSTFGRDNLIELKTITGNGLVYRTTDEMTNLLTPCFEILHSEENRYTLEFNEPLEILKHIKNTGVNATNPIQMWTKKRLNEFAEEYTLRFRNNDKYPLTYHPQYFICRKKGFSTTAPND